MTKKTITINRDEYIELLHYKRSWENIFSDIEQKEVGVPLVLTGNGEYQREYVPKIKPKYPKLMKWFKEVWGL